VSIVILNYNTQELLADCLRSLHDDPDHEQWQIIVVDNASSDDSMAMVTRDFPQAMLVALDRNLGFAKGNNRGAEIASGRHLLFLNADTVVLPGVVAALSDFLDTTPDAAIVGPRLNHPGGKFQCSFQPFPSTLGTLRKYLYINLLLRNFARSSVRALSDSDLRKTRQVDYVAGACLMICREYFERVGGWCEDYFLYGEDADLCAEVKRIGGKTYYYGPRHIIHIGGASADQVALPAILEGHRSLFLFVYRHEGPLAFWATRLTTMVGVLLRGLFTALALPVALPLGKAKPVWARLRKYVRVLGLCLSRNAFPTGGFLQ